MALKHHTDTWPVKHNKFYRVGGREENVEGWVWTLLEFSLVQILVRVATTQMWSLSTEVGEGFMTILISHEWVSPNWNGENLFIVKIRSSISRKGNELIFSYHDQALKDGDINSNWRQ